MLSRNTPARLDPDSEPTTPATSPAKAVSPRTAAKLRGKPAPGTPKVRLSLFSGSGRKASLTAPASKTGAKLPGRQKVTPANLRLGIMIGAALLLGAVSVYVNTSSPASSMSSTTDTATPFPPASLAGKPGTPPTSQSPAQGTANPVVVAGTPPVSGTPPASAVPETSAPLAGAPSATPSPFKAAQNTARKATSAPTPGVLPAAEGVIPDVFSAAQTDAASPGRTATPAPQGVNVSRAPLTLPGVPMAAQVQTVPVAAAVPLSGLTVQPSPVPSTGVQMMPTALRATLPPVQQLRPLPAPITAGPGAVTALSLTRPGLPGVTQPVQASSMPVSLIGIADGDSPTAILNTPAGQLMAAVGETVDVQGVPYTLSAIKTTSVVLTHAQDRITLTETP